MDFKGHLGGVCMLVQMLFVAGLAHRPVQCAQPGFHRTGQGITDRSGSVVKLGSATDVQTSLINFGTGARHPIQEQRLQPGQTTLQLHGVEKHLLLKLVVVFTNHRN